jgi:hypothetical protein
MNAAELHRLAVRFLKATHPSRRLEPIEIAAPPSNDR